MGSRSNRTADLFIKRAEESLAAAESLIESGFFRETVSRAYYSAYYAARACLSLENIHPKTHSGTISKFGEIFVKSGRTKVETGKLLNELEEDRQKCDYEISVDVDKKEAQRSIEDAKVFLEEALEIYRREK